jgi:hypothetical protein
MKLRRLLVLAGTVMSLLVSLTVISFAAPRTVFAGFIEPYPCTPDKDGATEEDEVTGEEWECTQANGEWGWWPKEKSGSSTFNYASGTSYSSSVVCVFNIAYISQDWFFSYQKTAGSSVNSEFPPCSGNTPRYQPAGEMRSRTVIQSAVSGGTYSTCRDTGYVYNSSTTSTFASSYNMGGGPDCGSGRFYRTIGYGQVFDTSWLGNGWITGGMQMFNP